MTKLTTAQKDRAAGVLLATACGDALGAGYEFGPALADGTPVSMIGGGQFGFAPGEWTDDTSMALVIADALADGSAPTDTAALDTIAGGWLSWSHGAKDVGAQTSAVLGAAHREAERAGRALAAADLTGTARRHHERAGRSGGNGSLMRTAPVALAYLGDGAEQALFDAAAKLSGLTHFDPEAGEACGLWCLAIRHAVRTGELDVRVGLSLLPDDRRAVWAARVEQAERSRPADFGSNGWVVEAFQGAWSAIATAPIPADDPAAGMFRAQHLQRALETAVRGGHDTDTVAAIAGGLLGAAHGASAVPAAWNRVVHGWPGRRAGDLTRLALRIAAGGRRDRSDTASLADSYASYPGVGTLVQHPHDVGVWLGGFCALRNLPEGVDAVVSLCQMGYDDVPADRVQPGNAVEAWLIDSPDPAENPNLAYVLHDAAAAVAQLRAEGRTVLLHCVQAQSRTPSVAALYEARRAGIPIDRALADIVAALPAANPNRAFRVALQALDVPVPHAAAPRAD